MRLYLGTGMSEHEPIEIGSCLTSIITKGFNRPRELWRRLSDNFVGAIGDTGR